MIKTKEWSVARASSQKVSDRQEDIPTADIFQMTLGLQMQPKCHVSGQSTNQCTLTAVPSLLFRPRRHLETDKATSCASLRNSLLLVEYRENCTHSVRARTMQKRLQARDSERMFLTPVLAQSQSKESCRDASCCDWSANELPRESFVFGSQAANTENIEARPPIVDATNALE